MRFRHAQIPFLNPAPVGDFLRLKNESLFDLHSCGFNYLHVFDSFFGEITMNNFILSYEFLGVLCTECFQTFDAAYIQATKFKKDGLYVYSIVSNPCNFSRGFRFVF